MPALRYALAGAALLLTGCDLTGGPDPVGAAVVTQVTVESAPLLQPDGGRWDGGLRPSDADVYISSKREDGSGGLINSRSSLSGGGVFDNVDASSFPLLYRPSRLGVEGTSRQEDLAAVYTLELRDADFGGSELMADLGTFTFGQYAPAAAGSATTFTRTSEDGAATVRVTVRWEP